MTREEKYNAAAAVAIAAADCAAAVCMTPRLTAPDPADVKNAQAYHDTVRRIGDRLTQDAIDQDKYAESLRPT